MSIKASAVRSQRSQNAAATHTSVIENSAVKGSEPAPSLNGHNRVSKKRPCDQWTSVGICIKGDWCQYLHDPQVRIAAIELFIISTHKSRSKKLYISIMKN